MTNNNIVQKLWKSISNITASQGALYIPWLTTVVLITKKNHRLYPAIEYKVNLLDRLFLLNG